MNRRKFLTRLAQATALALAAGASTVTLEGCTFNVEDAINMVLNSALSILKVAIPGASWIGASGECRRPAPAGRNDLEERRSRSNCGRRAEYD